MRHYGEDLINLKTGKNCLFLYIYVLIWLNLRGLSLMGEYWSELETNNNMKISYFYIFMH